MAENENWETENTEINLWEYLDLLRKHMLMIMISAVVGGILGLVFFMTQPKRYKATTDLKVDPLSSDSLRYGDSGTSIMGAFYFRNEYVNTEKKIMQSTEVVNRVLKNVGLDFFKQHAPIKEKSPSLLSLLRNSGSEEEELTEEQKEQKLLAKYRAMLKRNVRIEEERDTHLLSITFVSQSPKIAETVANHWADAYIQHGLELDLTRNKGAFTYIKNQIKALETETAGLVAEKANQENKLNFVRLGNNSSVDDERVTQLNQNAIQAQNEVHKANSRYEKLKASNAQDAIEVTQSPLVIELEKKLSAKNSKYAQDLEIYNAQYPKMVALDAEIKALEKEVKTLRQSIYDELIKDLRADVKAKQGFYDQLAENLKSVKKTSSEIRQELDSQIHALNSQIKVNRDFIEELNVKKESFDLAIQLKDLERSDKVVIERAKSPSAPFAPSLKKTLALGIVLGIILSVGIMLMRELLDRKIHNAEALQKISGLPTLALIPKVKERSLIKAADDLKTKIFQNTLAYLNKLSVTAKDTELLQIQRIAQNGLNNLGGIKDYRKLSDVKSEELKKISALAQRLLKTGSQSAVLKKILLETTYATSIGHDMQNPEDKKSKVPGMKYLSFLKSKTPKETDEVAYGQSKNDYFFTLRKVVGCFTHIKPANPFSEAYRHLRTNIQLSDTNQKKVLLLTSSVPGEGKTISSINLAIAFSQLDKRVLLIDGDLRRSKLHSVFKLKQEPGIVENLVGQADIKACIQSTYIPYLDLLSAGTLAPNPAELLASEKMEILVGELKKHYDYIIFDSSPVLAVTDACIIGHLADATLFVSKASKTNRDEVARALEILTANKIKPIGTLFNDLDRGGRIGYGKYGYSYGYGYGYGYSYKPKKT